MKVIGSVLVRNRLLPDYNPVPTQKFKRTSLSVGKIAKDNNDQYILLQTTRNTVGEKYKITHNVEIVFTKFLKEGKATIRLIEPQVDVIIQCDPLQLQCFLSVVKLAIVNHTVQSRVIKYLNDCKKSSSKIVPKPITKLIVNQSSDYPAIDGFPRTLQVIKIDNVCKRSLDSRILRLECLRYLHVTNSGLESLPEEIGRLSALSELVVANNKLSLSSDWKWISGDSLKTNLKLLDLRNNELKFLPYHLTRIQSLVNLKLDRNCLEALPKGLGRLSNLRYLSLSDNKLKFLPGSMLKLRLVEVDISKNEFDHCVRTTEDKNVSDASLQELAAAEILNMGLDFSEENLPRLLVQYLEDASYCLCGRPCLQLAKTLYFVALNTIALSYLNDTVCRLAPFQVSCCSRQCYTRAPRYVHSCPIR